MSVRRNPYDKTTWDEAKLAAGDALEQGGPDARKRAQEIIKQVSESDLAGMLDEIVAEYIGGRDALDWIFSVHQPWYQVHLGAGVFYAQQRHDQPASIERDLRYEVERDPVLHLMFSAVRVVHSDGGTIVYFLPRTWLPGFVHPHPTKGGRPKRNPDFGAADDVATLEVARDALREGNKEEAAGLLKHVTTLTLANMLIDRVSDVVHVGGGTKCAVFGFDNADVPKSRRGWSYWNYVWIAPNLSAIQMTEFVNELRDIDDPLFVDVEWNVIADGKNGEFRQFFRFFPMGLEPDRSWPYDYPWWDYEGPEIRGERMKIGRIKSNPSSAPNPDRVAAIEKYEEFSKFAPKKVGEFAASFKLPKRVRCVGEAKSVLYRSDKVDPASGRDPGRGIDYIHEHEGGVNLYVCSGDLDTDVPDRITKVTALTKLGTCLGYDFTYKGGEKGEAKAKRPMPELYCTPDGKCLLVIQDKKTVLAMMWGGSLGVEDRGIVG